MIQLERKEVLNINHRKKTKQFVCRLCGGTEYEGSTNSTPSPPLGSTVHASYYKCKQCSVLFKDPDLFSVGD